MGHSCHFEEFLAFSTRPPTFSRSMGVMCLPRAWLAAESCLRISGREEELDRDVDAMALSRVESSDATLEESSGTSTALLDSWRPKDQPGG